MLAVEPFHLELPQSQSRGVFTDRVRARGPAASFPSTESLSGGRPAKWDQRAAGDPAYAGSSIVPTMTPWSPSSAKHPLSVRLCLIPPAHGPKCHLTEFLRHLAQECRDGFQRERMRARANALVRSLRAGFVIPAR